MTWPANWRGGGPEDNKGQSRWFLRPCDGMVTASSRGCPLLLLDHGHASLDPRNLRRPISDSGNPPASCLNCEDERQYVNWKGQSRRSAAGVNASDVGVRESIPARVRSSVGKQRRCDMAEVGRSEPVRTHHPIRTFSSGVSFGLRRVSLGRKLVARKADIGADAEVG